MKERKQFRLEINHIFVLILVILITTVLTIIYLNHIRNLISDNTLKNLGEVTKQDAKNIENIIKEHTRILETIVNEIKENATNEEEIFNIYERNAGNQEFSRIAILYRDGKTSTSDGEIVDLSEDINYFFQTEEIQISKTRKSKVDTEEINIYSKKTVWNNQEVVILLVIETDKYEQLFSQSIYNGKGIEYLITTQGEITANSRNEENGKNIFDELKSSNKKNSKENDKNIKKIEEDINFGNNGQIIYLLDDNRNYIAYQKLEIKDWYLIIATPGNAIAEELNRIIEITFFITLVLITLISGTSIYIILSNIKKREDLYQLAYIDTVTNLGNKNYFYEKGKIFLEENYKTNNLKNKEYSRKEKFFYQNRYSSMNNNYKERKKLNKNLTQNNYLIVLDIDNFKSFNKKYGHKKGNELLNKIGEILKENLNENAIIARLANDAFGIIFEEKEDINQTIKKLERKLSYIKIEKEEYHIYLSIGIYKIKKDEKEISKILDKALIAHNKVKGNYNVQYMIFDEELEKNLEREHEIELNMQKALENEEFIIYYQPKVEISTEKIKGAEALVRWKSKDKMIPPNEFIPLFEKNQFIIKLDTYVFEKVCKDISNWKKEYKNIPLISINVSKEHLIEEDFVDEYLKIVNKYKIKPNELEIEITESIATEKNITEIIKKLKKVGFIVSIDDFGTGYSSLSMLQEMPIDVIKIDKKFIDQINFENKTKNIVQYIVLIAKKLEIKTLAEGVESSEQVKYLKELGCEFVQGYYYFKPLNKGEFMKLF